MGHLFGKELCIPFTVHFFCERLIILCVCFFPFCFSGLGVELVVLVPDHCIILLPMLAMILYAIDTDSPKPASRLL